MIHEAFRNTSKGLLESKRYSWLTLMMKPEFIAHGARI